MLDVDLLEAVNRDVVGDAAPAHDETLEELYDEVVGGGGGDDAGGPGGLLDGLGKFIDAFQKL